MSKGCFDAQRFLAPLLSGVVLAGCSLLPPSLPVRPKVERVVALNQGWSAEESRWFHHITQGSSTFGIPYKWLIALEQPRLSLFESPLLIEPEFMTRFGFIASAAGPDNPDALPVGFARDPDAQNPITGESEDAVGFTCAACHTAQITYRGVAMVIDGGPAMTDLGRFRRSLGLALAYTNLIPGRFARFADRVLGTDASEDERSKLRGELQAFLEAARQGVEREQSRTEGSLEEGFGRLDAIGRIGNTVFGTALDERNIDRLLAPVAYPHIWDSPWFDWVQYNGSIRQPMVRNAGEALGVATRVNLVGPTADLYRSNVRVQNLAELEDQLAGPAPWQGLRAPLWPTEVLGAIDETKAARGAELYAELCQGCHLPPTREARMAELRPPFFTPDDAYGRRYLKLEMVDVAYVGTDPNQAQSMRDRTVDLAQLGGQGASTSDVAAGTGPIEPFGSALARLTESVLDRWYDEQNIAPEERVRMNGYRPNDVRAPLAYKARPLDGIWATPPYLHNGSVPNLDALLGPASERPQKFWLGSQEFDPVRVGYVSSRTAGGFELDATQPGNSNAGHEFSEGPLGNGRIGRALSSDERDALIEFLKTL